MVSWPSGLRRSTQVRVRHAGVGSNPTGTTILVGWLMLTLINNRSKNAFDRGRTGDLGIMRPTRCQLRHESSYYPTAQNRSKIQPKPKDQKATNGIRTHDLSLTKRVLYQLSYSGCGRRKSTR